MGTSNIEIETTGDVRDQLIKVVIKHLLDMDYDFSMVKDEDITRIDLGRYGSLLIATDKYELDYKI